MSNFSEKRLSRIESLPVEIIQKIFLLSLEINLPRASIFIARAVSSPVIYRWFVRVAFSSNTNLGSSRHSFFTRDYLPEEVDFFLALSDHDKQQRVLLQNAILECRWCTLSVIQRCQQDYFLHVVRRTCKNMRFDPRDYRSLIDICGHFADPDRSEAIVHEMENRGIASFPATVQIPDQNTRKTCMKRELSIHLYTYSGSIEISDRNAFSARYVFRLPNISPTAPARIPDKLLSGPATRSKSEFLCLLSMAGAYLDDDRNHARSRHILQQLIRQRRFDMFQGLLRVRVRCKEDIGCSTAWPLYEEHFHDAIDYSPSKDMRDPFINMLFHDRAHDVPMGDRRLQTFLRKVTM